MRNTALSLCTGSYESGHRVSFAILMRRCSVVVLDLELIRLQVVSTFESSVVSVNRWPVDT